MVWMLFGMYMAPITDQNPKTSPLKAVLKAFSGFLRPLEASRGKIMSGNGRTTLLKVSTGTFRFNDRVHMWPLGSNIQKN